MMARSGRVSESGISLHLGCFDHVVPGWHNTDITPHIWIARVPMLAWVVRRAGLMTAERYEQHRSGTFRKVHYLNARRRFPFPDGSVRAVFSSHFLEHLFEDEARACLAEILRVLGPGGICRLGVPDLDRIVSEYDAKHPEGFLQRVFENSDRRSAKNVHHWHYNEHSLTRLLHEVGFKEAYRCAYRAGLCPDVELLDNRPEETLFVEGSK